MELSGESERLLREAAQDSVDLDWADDRENGPSNRINQKKQGIALFGP